MNEILKKRKKGATLPLVAACLIILIMLVAAFLGLNMQLGSKRQVQQALDAGTLNLTKYGTAMNKAGTMGVYTTLKPGLEQANFSFMANGNKVDLLHYNACVGQAILVALNAMEEGTQAANANATAVLNAVQSGSDSIGYRLSQQMATQSNLSTYFTTAANAAANSITMDVNSNKTSPVSLNSVTTGYVNAYNPASSIPNPEAVANVSINTSMYSPSIQSFINQYVNTARPDPNNPGFYLLNGYQPITFNFGSAPITIMAVTMPPNQGAHLGTSVVSASGFDTTSPFTAAVGAKATGAVPPNAFLVNASVNSTGSASVPQLVSTVSGVAGSWNQTYQPSIPNGYMQINNPAGIGFPGISNLPDTSANILNNELMTGVFVANNGSFSTDQNLLNQWVEYNQAGQKGTAPSNVGVFNASGNPASATDLSGITALGQNDASGNSVYECTWQSFSGPAAESVCQNLTSAFRLAYASTNSSAGMPAQSLIAVEAAKAQVIADYAQIAKFWIGEGSDPYQLFNYFEIIGSNNLDQYTLSSDNQVATIGATGLQIFNHNAYYIDNSGVAYVDSGSLFNKMYSTVNNNGVSISKPGSIWGYLNDIQDGSRTALVYPLASNSAGTGVMSESEFKSALQNAINAKPSSKNYTPIGQIVQRIIQLEPNKSVATLASDIYNVLVNTQIPMNSSFFISVNYNAKRESDGSFPIQLSMSAPAGYNASSPQQTDGNSVTYSTSYSIIGLSVDPPHELGIHDQLLTYQTGNLMGNDSVTWTPSSGYGNLVGNLSFSNYLSGAEEFAAPN